MSSMQLEFNLGDKLRRAPSISTASQDGSDLSIALQPTETASREASDLADKFKQRLRVIETTRPLHVTLQSLGRCNTFSDMELAAKKEELSSVSFKPFMLKFDQVMSFRRKEGKWALVLCCRQSNASLFELRRQIAEAQRQPGVDGKSIATFTPHMTLFYSHKVVLRRRLKTPICWLVRDFHMIWSHSGEGRHESLWHWPPSA